MAGYLLLANFKLLTVHFEYIILVIISILFKYIFEKTSEKIEKYLFRILYND